MKAIPAILCCLLSYFALSAQNGALKLRIFPMDAVIYVDSQKVASGSMVSIPCGTHRIRTWAPTYQYVDTIIVVFCDSMTLFSKMLHHSEQYLQYKNDLKAYEAPQRNFKTNLMVAGFYGAAWLGTDFFFRRKMKDQVKLAEDLFEHNNANLSEASYVTMKAEYEEIQKTYCFFRTTRISFNIASTLFTSYLIYKAIKNKKNWDPDAAPVFREEKRLSLGMMMSPETNGLTLTWNF